MPWMPGATKRDVGAAQGRYTNGPMRSHTGAVLHCNDADSYDLFGWITGNNGMSCHFQVAKDGTVFQYIDTAYSSWAQINGNDDYVSIETSGKADVLLTDAQLASTAKIMAWLHTVHGIPFTQANAPGEVGLGWHGMGAAAGWGHSVCPGVRRSQIPTILSTAKPVPAPAPKPTPAPAAAPRLHRPWPSYMKTGHYFGLLTGPVTSHGGYYASERPDVAAIQKRLQVLRCNPGAIDGQFGPATARAVTAWQHAHMPGTTFYGQVWADDWHRLFTY